MKYLYEIIKTGTGTRLVRDKIVYYYDESLPGGHQTVVHLVNGEKIAFDPDKLSVDDIDEFMSRGSVLNDDHYAIYNVNKQRKG